MSFILYTRRNHKRCSSRFDILDNSAIDGLEHQSRNASQIHRDLHVSSAGITTEIATKMKGSRRRKVGRSGLRSEMQLFGSP